MSLKPWRELAIPHADVLKGTFLQSEFAADISAVHSGKAPAEYRDAAPFFERTYITEGMRLHQSHFPLKSNLRNECFKNGRVLEMNHVSAKVQRQNTLVLIV